MEFINSILFIKERRWGRIYSDEARPSEEENFILIIRYINGI